MENPFIEKSFRELLKLEYHDICAYYAQKYGHPLKDYFVDNSFQTISNKNKRIKDGLIIHHIDEDKIINLDKKVNARKYPFAYQKKERLIYCNYLERLLLYIKIFEFNSHQNSKKTEIIADKIYEFIVPELNDIFSGMKYKTPAKNYAIKVIVNQKISYLILLKYLIQELHYDQPLLTTYNIKYRKHFLVSNLKLYENIIQLGLDLDNEHEIWIDFFFSVIHYIKDKKDVDILLDWFWHNFHQQISRSTDKEDIFKYFMWAITDLFSIEEKAMVWYDIIEIMFGRCSNASDEKKINIIKVHSNFIYKELQKDGQGGLVENTYEKERQVCFECIAKEEEEKENNKNTILEKEMSFLTILITLLIDYVYNF